MKQLIAGILIGILIMLIGNALYLRQEAQTSLRWFLEDRGKLKNLMYPSMPPIKHSSWLQSTDHPFVEAHLFNNRNVVMKFLRYEPEFLITTGDIETVCMSVSETYRDADVQVRFTREARQRLADHFAAKLTPEYHTPPFVILGSHGRHLLTGSVSAAAINYVRHMDETDQTEKQGDYDYSLSFQYPHALGALEALEAFATLEWQPPKTRTIQHCSGVGSLGEIGGFFDFFGITQLLDHVENGDEILAAWKAMQ